MKNRDDFKKWLLATGEYANEIQDDFNTIVGYNEKFNNVIVRHTLDLKDEAIFCYPNPINVTFHDLKKLNPVIGKLATQVKASKLTNYQLTKKNLQQEETDELQLRLDKLKYRIKKDDDDDNNNTGQGGGGRGGMLCPPGPPTTPRQEMDDIVRRLDYLHSNTPDVPPYNTREQNSRIIARKNNEKFVNQQAKQRQREISN